MAADVPFHFKQWGDWAPSEAINLPRESERRAQEAADGTMMFRVGKKFAGRTLDGTTWDGLPAVRTA